MDTNKLLTDLVEAKTSVATLTASAGTLTADLSAAQTKLTAAEAEVADLTTKLAAAQAQPTNQADYEIAVAFLTETLGKVITASGADLPAEMPKTVADLKAAIEDKTAKLTAILPVGGAAAAAGGDTDEKPALIRSAFSNRNFGK